MTKVRWRAQLEN